MDKRNYSLAILKPDSNDMYINWINAINESDVDINYQLINIENESWIRELTAKHFDMVLVSPPLGSFSKKELLDERLYFIRYILGINIYPDYNSFLVWENKRMLNYYLNHYKIPTPQTHGFYSKKEALKYINSCEYPLVAKVVTGAAGLGVKIIDSSADAKKYIRKAFSKGVENKTGPDFRKPHIVKRIWRGLKNRKYLDKKLTEYKTIANEKQIGFVYFQEFIPHTYEWRCVRIDDSFFAHKKIVKKNKASGSLIKGYEKPSEDLLSFVKKTSDTLGITSASFDIFETSQGDFLVNEVQTFFGQSDKHQMIIDGIPGRYTLKNDKWEFESGSFNQNKSYNLRLAHVIKLLENNI